VILKGTEDNPRVAATDGILLSVHLTAQIASHFAIAFHGMSLTKQAGQVVQRSAVAIRVGMQEEANITSYMLFANRMNKLNNRLQEVCEASLSCEHITPLPTPIT
jgi:hypothetical protein